LTDSISSILSASLLLATPILLSDLGEVFSERAGVMNLGVEGIMALAAFGSVWVTFVTGSYALGLLAGVLVGGLAATIHSFACVSVGINQLISGLMIFSLAGAIANFGYRSVSGAVTPTVVPLEPINIPGLSQVPYVGPFLFGQNALVYGALALAVGMGFILYRTTWGLSVRGVGEAPQACDAAGINVKAVRHACVILGGLMAGLGGASMTVGYLGIYQGGIVAGRGWIAIVVVIFARWSPYRVVLGSWMFGLGFSIASNLIGTGVGIPYYLLLMLPYLLALLVILFVHKGTKPPSALTVPFRRG
jgi:simple sugar transport system permease protein